MNNYSKISLDFECLKRFNANRLVEILEEASGTKDLVIDGSVMKVLDRIADTKTLKKHGVCKMFALEEIPPNSVEMQIIYFTGSDQVRLKWIIDHIKFLQSASELHIKFYLIIIPRITYNINLYLEEEGLFGLVRTLEFNPDFISLDHDLLSLEMNCCFSEIFLENDYSSCISIAKALNTLISLYGPICHIFGHGRASETVFKHLNKILEESPQRKYSDLSSNMRISEIYLFDRDADFVSLLLTQLTYAGALDEKFSINAGVVEFPKQVTNSDASKKIILNSNNTVFHSIADKHLAGVSGHLVREARRLQEMKEQTKSMNTKQMKEFVSYDLKNMQLIQSSLSLHISACEYITKNTRKDFDQQLVTEHGLITGAISSAEARNYIEDCIARQLPSSLAYKLFCLYSTTQQGISAKEYEIIASQILNAYGYDHIFTLNRLKSMGLLLLEEANSLEKSVSGKKDSSKPVNTSGAVLNQVVNSLVKKQTQWKSVCRKLNSIPNADQYVDLHNPSHISYIFNGAYSPIIPNIVQDSIQKNFGSLSEIVKHLPGSTINHSYSTEAKATSNRCVIVSIIGGITYAEISALRLVGDNLNVKIIIAATNIINANSVVSAAFT